MAYRILVSWPRIERLPSVVGLPGNSFRPVFTKLFAFFLHLGSWFAFPAAESFLLCLERLLKWREGKVGWGGRAHGRGLATPPGFRYLSSPVVVPAKAGVSAAQKEGKGWSLLRPKSSCRFRTLFLVNRHHQECCLLSLFLLWPCKHVSGELI